MVRRGPKRSVMYAESGNYTRNGHDWNPMPDMELESFRGRGSYFWKGGSRKGGFGRTPWLWPVKPRSITTFRIDEFNSSATPGSSMLIVASVCRPYFLAAKPTFYGANDCSRRNRHVSCMVGPIDSQCMYLLTASCVIIIIIIIKVFI